jgi:hypothetical protein
MMGDRKKRLSIMLRKPGIPAEEGIPGKKKIR